MKNNLVKFKNELTVLVNKYSIDNEVNMPDFIISEMLCNILKSIRSSSQDAKHWNTLYETIYDPKSQITLTVDK